MTRLISVPLDDGTTVVVEEADAGGVVRAGRPGEVVAQAQQTLEASLDGVVRLARATIGKLREAEQQVRSIDVELGVKFTAQAGVVVASASTEANLKITFHWERGPATP